MKKTATRNEVLAAVKAVAVRQFGCEPAAATEDASLVADLGADSLDIICFIQEIEAYFGLGIADDDAAEMETIGEYADHLFARRDEFGSSEEMTTARRPMSFDQEDEEDWDEE